MEGALDLRVHSAGCSASKMHDLELAQRFIVGYGGILFEIHYFCTSAVHPEYRKSRFQAMGAVVLNSAVGGLNPAVVRWLPFPVRKRLASYL